MDPSSGYSTWPMQPNSNPELAWHLGPNNMPQSNGSAPMQSMYAPTSSTSSTMTSTLYPAFPNNQQHFVQQQQQLQPSQQPFYQQPQAYQQQSLYPQQYTSATPLPSTAASDAVPTSVGFSGQDLSINATTFAELKALYPNASQDQLINAIFHTPTPAQSYTPTQPQAQQHHLQQPMLTQLHQHQSPALHTSLQSPPPMQASPTYSQSPRHDVYAAQSSHSLANALTFTSPPSVPVNIVTIPSQAHAAPQSGAPAFPPIVGDSQAQPSTSRSIASDADGKKKTKLRQTKLTSLSGIARAVSKEATQSPPSGPATPKTSTDVTVVSDHGSEPGTPPLPPAKALAVKPTPGGSTSSSNTVPKASASTTTTADSALWTKAKQPLSRLSVERTPEQSARQLVQILCEVDSAGRFRQVVSTGAEVRTSIIEMLNAIATLEKGRGYTDNGRKKFFAAWMGIPGGRHILSTWLRQTVPPKKVSEGVADLSRRYKNTLLPLLHILDYVPIKKAYLTDDAGLGKAITGVSLRAVDLSARKRAEILKAKWTKVVESESSAMTATSSTTASNSATAAKRKSTESTAPTESSTKRYKSATAVGSASSSAKTVKAAPTQPTSTAAKPGLSFFGSGTARKPPAAASSAASGTNRMNAHQSVMSLMDKLSGGTGSDRATLAQAEKQASTDMQTKERPKKRVRWREESELVAIKLIEPADYSQGDDGDASEPSPVGLGDEHDEGLALRQSVSTMEAQMDWYEPREVIITVADSGPVGSESVEGPFQARRQASLEEVVYEDGKEPECPDESQLEQPGTIVETPDELKGENSVEIPTPWMEEYAPGMVGMDESEAQGEGSVEPKAEPTATSLGGAAPITDVSALLAKVGQAFGSGSNAVAASASSAASSAAPPTSTTTAGSAPLSFDPNQLQSLLAAANGKGPTSNVVNAAMANSNVTSTNISSLLSSLQSSVAGSQTNTTNGVASANEGKYWQSTYRENGVGAMATKQESYPGEYQEEYQQGVAPSHQYGQPARSGYRAYGARQGWDDQPHEGGYGRGPSSYNGGNGGGGWHSTLHTVPCKFYLQGTCRNGANCRFRHD